MNTSNMQILLSTFIIQQHAPAINIVMNRFRALKLSELAIRDRPPIIKMYL